MKDLSRRRFVLATGAVAASGALAGCGGNGNGHGNGNGNGNGADDSPEGRATAFLDDQDAREWDGDIAEQDTVDVGAGGEGLAFSPPAIRVEPGTTVTWEWTGDGGGHNVVSEGESDFEFESERTDEGGHTFEQTFDEEGVALYVCTPHRAQGMYGAVVVE